MRQLLAKGWLGMCKMPMGVENFRELMEGNYYFVDKAGILRRLDACEGYNST